ncbi:MAG: diacylglycerol/lipid kinase family protein [Planctomycetota bacterium]
MRKPVLTLPPEKDCVVVSLNPRAGRRSAGHRAGRLVDLLGHNGFRVEVFTDLEKVATQANRLHSQGRLRVLVGVGGDGTAAELVNRTDEGVPLTLLAAGTANLLSRHFGLTGRPKRLCQTIVDGKYLRLDAGKAGGRLFLIMIGCGFDAEVVRRVHAERQARPGGYIGYLSYLKPILESIRRYEYPEIQVYCESRDNAIEGRGSAMIGRWAFAFNLPCYGWGLPLAPDALPTDGLLDVCTFRRGTLFHGLRYLVAVQCGAWHRRMTDCQMGQARRFQIRSEEPVAYHLDGDPAGQLPVDVEVLPNRLCLVVPWRDGLSRRKRGVSSG